MNKILLGALAVIALGLIGWFVLGQKNQPAPTGSNSTSSSTSSAQTTPTETTTITFDGSSFSPSSVTVKSGSTVAFKNDSSEVVQVQSNPHPLHTDDLDLNIGSIEPGQVGTAVLTKTGTFGYHNHLNPSQGGTITIQ